MRQRILLSKYFRKRNFPKEQLLFLVVKLSMLTQLFLNGLLKNQKIILSRLSRSTINFTICVMTVQRPLLQSLKTKNLFRLKILEINTSTFDWYYSYRCKIQNDNFQLLKFDPEMNNTSGLIEIEKNKLSIRYLKLK